MAKNKSKDKNQAQVPAVKLTETQKDRISTYLKKSDNQTEPLKFSKNTTGAFGIIGINDKNKETRSERFSALNLTTGMLHPDSSVALLSQAAMSKNPKDEHQMIETLREAATMMLELQPQDATEGLLISQMVAGQNQIMSCLRHAEKADFIDHREMHLRFADRFMKTFTKQMEALMKYRRGGEQKMVVEHVNVNKGGKAVIGNVNQGGGQNNEKK